MLIQPRTVIARNVPSTAAAFRQRSRSTQFGRRHVTVTAQQRYRKTGGSEDMDRLTLAVEDPFTAVVSDYMSEDVTFLRPDMELKTDPVLHQQFVRFSGLPVVDPDMRVIGIVSHKDLNKATTGSKVKDYMTTPVHTVRSHCNVASALTQMLANKCWRLPVCDDRNRLVGILSRSDLLQPVYSTEEELRTFGEILERREHLNALRREHRYDDDDDDVYEMNFSLLPAEFFSNFADDADIDDSDEIDDDALSL
jgi:CBS domain-containing protein